MSYNLLDDILEQHKEYESPLEFWRWAGLAAISAIIKDNVWLERAGLYNLYANIYVMFHATSGLRKGVPVNYAKRLVRAINNTKIISGRSSIQGILKKLSTAYTQPGGKVINKATAFICSSELSASLVEDKAATDILTDLYDRIYNEGDWERLLASDSVNLKDATVTMLTATNEAHSEDFLKKKDIQGGFVGRTFIIYADRINKINPLIDSVENPPDDKRIIEYLRATSKLKGPFKSLSKTEAGELYKQWYTPFMQGIIGKEDETGTLARFGDSVLKVAMLLALAKSPELEIDIESMQEAIIQCEKFIGHARKVTMGKSGKSAYANQKVMIIQKILDREPHMITQSKLMMDMHYHLNSNELDDIMEGFHKSGLIKQERHGNQVVYVMPDEQVERVQNWLKGKR